jgi:Fe2+ or Zn2+ uptake regulation protein
MDRGESIEKLAGLLSADEYGDVVSEMLVEILAEERKRNIFVVRLQELANELKAIDQEIRLTPMEQGVLGFVIATKQPLNASEASDGLGAEYPSLRHRTHASSVLNSLVSKGVLGKIKVSSSQYFTTPAEAVMECLKKRGEEPDRCSPVRIADETGMPLAVVLEVIGGLLGSG